MRLIKAFLTGAAVLFVIITLFSLLIPARVRVSRVVVINNRAPGDVYPQVSNFENWKKWHPVFTADSAKLDCNGTAINEAGPVCKIIHHGREIIITTLPGDSTTFKFSLKAKGENDIDNDIILTNLPAQRAVQVEWKSVTKLHWYPWEKFYGIFIDKLTGPGYETALNGLKEYIDKMPVSPPGSNGN